MVSVAVVVDVVAVTEFVGRIGATPDAVVVVVVTVFVAKLEGEIHKEEPHV